LQIGKTSLELNKGDITELDCDAIVNPANTQLKMGGGVAGAVSRKGGAIIQKECDEIGSIRVGEARITHAGELKARFVIHAVGPRLGEGEEDRKLALATINSLKLADKNNLKSIGFPAISTGIFRFPIDRCAKIMLSKTIDYLQGETGIDRVVFCLYDVHSFEIFNQTLNHLVRK